VTRVRYQELHDVLARILTGTGMTLDRATLCASLFADASRDGVSSHGVNRFPRFVRMIRAGIVDVDGRPERVASTGALERWDGKSGPGNLNAHECMDRALALARDHGIGCVALANTNHWMRGGTYGWQAAEAGAIGICWTNTLANLPPWGAEEPRIGNNPLVVAVPRPPAHVVLDMALSQFSVGALAAYRMRGELLPVDGGFDREGRLTRNAAAIESSGRLLPIGFWKGSGLSIVLDMMAALLSGGLATHQIDQDPEKESGLSQVFMAFNLRSLCEPTEAERAVDNIIEYIQAASANGGEVRYPGQRTLQIRRQNLEEGIPIEPSVWQEVQRL
jgi:3-dehydro-L-gulonate 2-dehydrogenase